MMRTAGHARGPSRGATADAALAGLIAEHAQPLPDIADAGFADAFDAYADVDVVLIGDGTHGTSEFYRARAAITQRLITQHGFRAVAIEADWPDASTVNRYVQGDTPLDAARPPFQRFPAWMWRNREMAAFVRWLREHNAGRPRDQRAGLYGLDIYSLDTSMAAVLAYLDRLDPDAAALARSRYGCLSPWIAHPIRYGGAVLHGDYEGCARAVVAQCRDLLERELSHAAELDADFFDAAENARVVAAAEEYYRAAYLGSQESWNLRDMHMADTLDRIRRSHGATRKVVVWAHNSHVGDARATDMAHHRGELNIGQLCRQRYGLRCVSIGMGTYAGQVAAADAWDQPMQVMDVRPALPDSHEHCMHGAGIERFLLDLGDDDDLRGELHQSRLERFIGVIYLPQTERLSHYMRAELAGQFDAWVWFDRTSALQPADDWPTV